jgi:uroporphyrinogen III methyltransferase/synthase
VNTGHGDNDTPLSGRTIVVTRRKEQAKEFSDILMRNGAEVILFPAVEIVEPPVWNECDSSLERIEQFSGILFTSVNAVNYFFHRASLKKKTAGVLHCQLYAVGEKTKSAIESFGGMTETIPEHFSGEELGNFLVRNSVKGKKFLFPKGNLGKGDIVSVLISHGASVETVTVYHTREPQMNDERRRILKDINERADMITFFSPSSVRHYVRQVTPGFVKRKKIAVIGETTADAVRSEGLDVVLVAPRSTAESFAEAITQYYRK